MQAIRAFSASLEERVRLVGPSMSKDGWGWPVAVRWSLTTVVFSRIWVASSRIREAFFILRIGRDGLVSLYDLISGGRFKS